MATSLYSLREYKPITDQLVPPNDPTFLETFRAQTAYSYNPLVSTLEAYSKFGGMGKGRLYRDEDFNPFDMDFTGYEGHEQFLIENSANKNHMAHLMTQIDVANKARETLSRASFLKQIGAGLLDPINLVTLPFGGPTIGFVRSAARVGLGVGAITAVQEAARVPFDPTNQGALEPAMNIGLGIATGAVLGGALSFVAITPKERMRVRKAEEDLRKDIETFASDKTTMNRQEYDQRAPVADRIYGKQTDDQVFDLVKRQEATVRNKQNLIDKAIEKIEVAKSRINASSNPKLKPLYKRVRDSFDEVGKLLVERGKLNKDVDALTFTDLLNYISRRRIENKGEPLSSSEMSALSQFAKFITSPIEGKFNKKLSFIGKESIFEATNRALKAGTGYAVEGVRKETIEIGQRLSKERAKE